MAIEINIIAVLVAAIASFVVGMLWYSPALFGNTWIRLMGFSEEEQTSMKNEPMTKKMTLAFIGNLVMAGVLSHMLVVWSATEFAVWGSTALTRGLSFAFWIWLALFATSMLGSVLWEKKPWKLYFINASYQLVNLLVIAAILGAWM